MAPLIQSNTHTKRRTQKMDCPYCEMPMRQEVRSEVIDYLTPDGHIHIPVDVPYEVCDHDGFSCFGHAGEIARTAAVKSAVECGH